MLEFWTIRKEDEKIFRTAEMYWLRNVAGISELQIINDIISRPIKTHTI